MKPMDWLWIVLGVLAVIMAASFIYWKARQRKRARRFAGKRRTNAGRRPGFYAEADFAPQDDDTYCPDPWRQGASYGVPPQPARPQGAYTPEEIARRAAAWRFRPVAPVYINLPGGQGTEMNAAELCRAARCREQDVLSQHEQVLTAYCEAERESEAKRAVDEQIQDMYFAKTGLDMVSEAVCDLIEGELQRGLSAQRLRVRLYNTYLKSARNILDTLTVKLMASKAVREHPDYQELALTLRQTDAAAGAGPRYAGGAEHMQPPFQPVYGPDGYQQDEYADAFGAQVRRYRGLRWLETMLGLELIVMHEDARQILCAHEDNMEKIRRAVEKMEADEKPDAYEIRYLPLLIALRKAYCSDFVLTFDKTIDTMPGDVCEQQLKNLRDALQSIREAYIQYPAM